MEVRVEDRGPSRLHLGPSTFIRRLRRENWNGKIIIRKRGKRKEKIVLTEKKKRERGRERERERNLQFFPFIRFLDLLQLRSRKLVSNIPKNSKLRATHMGLNESSTRI